MAEEKKAPIPRGRVEHTQWWQVEISGRPETIAPETADRFERITHLKGDGERLKNLAHEIVAAALAAQPKGLAPFVRVDCHGDTHKLDDGQETQSIRITIEPFSMFCGLESWRDTRAEVFPKR